MSEEKPNPEDVRAHAQSIVERARQDTAFAEALKSDPEAALRDAGFDERAIPEFAAELTDVEAHTPCGSVTCLVTCALTNCGLYTL